MTTNAATGQTQIDTATGATDLSAFERHSYSGDQDEQMAFERLVRLCKGVASHLRAEGPGVVAVIADHVCWGLAAIHSSGTTGIRAGQRTGADRIHLCVFPITY